MLFKQDHVSNLDKWALSCLILIQFREAAKYKCVLLLATEEIFMRNNFSTSEVKPRCLYAKRMHGPSAQAISHVLRLVNFQCSEGRNKTKSLQSGQCFELNANINRLTCSQ